MSVPGWRPRPPPGPRPRPLSPRRRERRARYTGLFVSGLFHLILITFYPRLTGDVAVYAPVLDPSAAPIVVEGTRIVDIVELSADAAEPAVPQIPTEAPQTAAPQPEAPAAEGPQADEATEAPDGPTLAERLQPQMVDPRIWAPVDPQYTELSDQQRAQLLLRGMIRSWNDSMAVAQALSDQATDWTYTDDEGRRWGLSPGRLHLGDFSIPLPFTFQLPPGRREVLAERQWIRDDLARGAATAIIRETWAERARAIRERLEAERAGQDATGVVDNGNGGGLQ